MQASVPVAAPPYLQGLNDVQREAVETLDGPLLVLAGAGTGKTRVLTTRLAHLLHTNKARPGEILAVTFTNKAAQEMKMRVSDLLGGHPVEGWWLGTFHSIAARMLRIHADLVGLSSQFTIIDSDDQQRLMKQLMEAAKLDVKKTPPKAILSQIDRWKDKAILPDQVNADEAQAHDGLAVRLYRQYQARLKILNACDFGDLMLHMITIFRDPANESVLQSYHDRFRYVMVDEYQDTNGAQYLWLRLLAKGSNNICCVGDDDQSIYGWRGAEVGNILRFERDFTGAKMVRLEQNYRSTSHILSAADGVIAHNENRLGKGLWSDKGEGDKVVVHGLWDGEAEARWVGEQIEQLQRQTIPLNQMAVLVRAGFQMREFEERFISLGIAYRVIGGPRFYERREIRDALAYFRVVMQPHDDLALERIINTPKRGIGQSTVQNLYVYARANAISLHEAILQLVETDEIKPKQRGTLRALMADFARWRESVERTPHPELAGIILDESGYTAHWQSEKTLESQGRLDNLKELVSAMAEYDSFDIFLEHVSLVLDAADNNTQEQATIMTLHGAKGLEFDCVFLPGWEEGLFPSQRSMDENGLKGLEEERRLAYVGITRARQRAFISHVFNRRMYGSWVNALPSRFCEEIPEAHKDMSADTGVYGFNPAGRSSHWDSLGTARPAVTLAALAEERDDVFTAQCRVHHDKFGPGTVIHVDGNKLDVIFDHAGRKRVMSSFVTKT